MRTSFLLLLLLSFLGCTRDKAELKDVLPVEVQRAWTLRQAKEIAPDEAPELVRSLGLKRALEAQYEGNGRIAVRLYQMKVDASAFELIQKWPQSEGLAAYKDSYFLVAVPGGPDQQTVASFLAALRQNLK